MLPHLSLFFLSFLLKDFSCLDLDFTLPSELENEGGYVVLGLTLMKLDTTPYAEKKWRTLRHDLTRMVHTLLYNSPNTNIHFVIISNKLSLTGLIYFI